MENVDQGKNESKHKEEETCVRINNFKATKNLGVLINA